MAREYIRQLESHEIYRADETHALLPYCVSITMYPFLLNGLSGIGGMSDPPKNLDSYCGGFINLVFAVAAQFAGAVATPEFLVYMDYFIRKEYGDDYYKHADDVVSLIGRRRTILSVIDDKFSQVVYSLNQPAAARNFQSVFWNISYFDKYYFSGMFDNFAFPDGDIPVWESVNWLQKHFMKWFNAERLKKVLTFPVESVNLVDNGNEYLDHEWFDFAAEMWAEGHSFFCYRSDSVDSLSSCCFSKDTKVLVRSTSDGKTIVYLDTFENIGKTNDGMDRTKFSVFHNGSWCSATKIKLPNRQMYKVTTANNKEIVVSDNHLNPTLRGDVRTDELTEDDYLLFNTRKLDAYPECDLHLTYEDGLVTGGFLSGKISSTNNHDLNMECLLQSEEFRRGMLDGWYRYCGCGTNKCYTTSKEICDYMEALITSLGMNSTITTSDTLYTIQWYDMKNERSMKDVYKVVNNSVYFKVKSIENVDYDDEIYCFEMDNKDEPYFTLPNGLITHNCRLRNELVDNTFSYTLGAGGIATGSKGVITMNINRLVQNAVRDGRDIGDAIREQTAKIHKYLIAWNELLKDSLDRGMLPVYDAGFISLEKQYLTVGINGFAEGAEFLGISPTPNKDYFKYGEMILKPIYEMNKADKTNDIMFNTEFIPAESLGVKNAAWDKADGYVVPRDCYNSYFYRVEDNSTNILDKLILHGKLLTKYLDGGSAAHLNLEEHLSKEQYKTLLKAAITTGCSYFTFNIQNTICNECGHISKHRLARCEQCGSEDLDYITRIIGYLKRVSRFSEARQREEKRRYYDRPTEISDS